jgi:hypothetical protein
MSLVASHCCLTVILIVDRPMVFEGTGTAWVITYP